MYNISEYKTNNETQKVNQFPLQNKLLSAMFISDSLCS